MSTPQFVDQHSLMTPPKAIDKKKTHETRRRAALSKLVVRPVDIGMSTIVDTT